MDVSTKIHVYVRYGHIKKFPEPGDKTYTIYDTGIHNMYIYDFFKENSLVNSVGEDMNLGQGKVAPVISKKAGPKLQEECNRLAPIKNGEVKATDAYKMKPCKKILHCCLPKFTSSREIQVTYYHVNSRDVAIQCFYAHDFNSNSALDSVHIFLFKLSSCSKLDVNQIQNTIQTLMFHPK